MLFLKIIIIYQYQNYYFVLNFNGFAGADEEFKSAADITGASDDFYYLSNSMDPAVTVADRGIAADYLKDFHTTRKCLASIGIDSDYQQVIFSLLSAILHLGNVTFGGNDSEGNTGPVIGTCEFNLAASCKLLGVTREAIVTALSTRNMYVGGSTIVKEQSKEQVVIC